MLLLSYRDGHLTFPQLGKSLIITLRHHAPVYCKMRVVDGANDLVAGEGASGLVEEPCPSLLGVRAVLTVDAEGGNHMPLFILF